MKSGARDEAVGTSHKIKGRIKEVIGQGSMNSALEADGKKENRAGKVQEKAGEIKKVIGK